ncbi:DUF805 domain-containing protein [Bifidobacterium pullorum]|uniref:DUF805 domain-containing protein n=1 Tax=Bifidobacterium pullorum TaxID=78448 RepID=UPI000558057F|nr:DUF805 domain-containing protein [Bifidobacterium pullorum]
MRDQYQVPFDDPSDNDRPSCESRHDADAGSYGAETPDRGNTAIAPVSGRPAAATYPLDLPYPGCPPIQAVERFFRNYATFSGRASRSEFWWPTLMMGIAETVLGALTAASDIGIVGTVQGILSFALLVPSLAVSVRRLHDINLNGTWLIPFAGLTVLGSALSVMGAMAAVFVLFLVPDIVEQGVNLILLGSIIATVAGVAYAVCMAWPSNPAGARFDKRR